MVVQCSVNCIAYQGSFFPSDRHQSSICMESLWYATRTLSSPLPRGQLVSVMSTLAREAKKKKKNEQPSKSLREKSKSIFSENHRVSILSISRNPPHHYILVSIIPTHTPQASKVKYIQVTVRPSSKVLSCMDANHSIGGVNIPFQLTPKSPEKPETTCSWFIG